MYLNMTKYIIFLIANLLLFPLFAQEQEHINFTHIGVNEGLSQSTIFGITQDRQGNMWFATYDGLNRYNGYDFTVFQHDEQNPYSIQNDIIQACIIDSQGRLWAGTDEGLSLYDAAKESFYNFPYEEGEKKQPITAIVEISGKQLLLLSKKREALLLFDTEKHQFSHTPLHPSLIGISPTAISRQGDHIYIGSYQGVFAYSISTKSLKNIVPERLKGKQILSFLQQSPILLWIGTEGDGLFRINLQTQEVTNYIHVPGKENSISSNYIRSLALDSQNRLWVGTIHSLNIYNVENDSFRSYTADILKNGSLSQTSVRCIFMDSQGGVWLGTYFGGLNYYHPLKNRFHNLQFIANRQSLNDNIIGCIREDYRKGLWIGTNNGGLNHYNTQTGKFTYYTTKEGLGANDIKYLYVDESKNLVYIGTHTGGLSILNLQSGHIETIREREFRNIYFIEPTENGELWISGIADLLRFNPQTRSITNVTALANGQPLLPEQITTALRDSKHRLWLGGQKGLAVYTEKGGELTDCPIIPATSSIHHQSVNCIHEARNGIFWIGTRSGIYRFDEKQKEIKQYTTAQGLANNVIHGILEDSSGKLWLSTNKGLNYFLPETEKFRNYTNNDGLASNQFTNNAYCQTSDGQMYFGGIEGITTFRPELLADNPHTPPVVITRLRLFNKPVYPDDETGILEKAINDTRSITLSAAQSMFSLDFVVSNYISSEHNTFAYMLKGYDKEWYYSNNQRTVSYSNLPQGTYRFLVKAANSDGKWNETPTELEIIILPAWYMTWWAILLFVLVSIAIIIFIVRYFWLRKSMETKLQMERIDKERQKEVNEMKLRFFINISHELRTPLTMILAPLQDIMEKINDRWIHKQLEHIQRNTNRLLHLVNQLMDYRRAELGVFNLKVKYTPIHETIEKDFLFYDKVAQHKKITYRFYSEIEDKKILCDPNYLELIINNLLSNAFKYTGEGKSITVVLKAVNNELLLQVKDTGNGIPIGKQEKIFERFYQIDNEHIGSGIGLSLVQRLVELHHGRIELESAEGKGSTFSIYLPTDEASYKPEERVTLQEDKEQQQVYTTNSPDMYMIDTESEKSEVNEEDKEAKGQRDERILIVEDNIEIQQYLSDELGKTYRILKAGNGEEALGLIKEQEIDLVLTDVMMPVMDGLQLCKLIKQNLQTCHIPVIVLSAKADLKEQLEGLQVGADDYIPKPFSLVMVATKIKNLFRTRRRAIDFYSKSMEIEPEKVALNPLDEELLKKAIEVMEKHMDDIEFTTDEFARELCMSRSNLHLKMKALTGESTNEFIRKMRFNKACKLLKEGKYTVAEISSMVGYNTPSYFAACFKKYMGCLPSEYGKQ